VKFIFSQRRLTILLRLNSFKENYNNYRPMRKTIEVTLYFSSFCTFEVEAESKEEAILKARCLKIDRDEIFSNLENWDEADTAIEIENDQAIR
jgi:hypothetical protein